MKQVRKHKVALSDRELRLLADRLVPISPLDYNLEDCSTLRDLYGRFEHLILMSEVRGVK